MYKYLRGVNRLLHGRYEASINDFQWILDNGITSTVTKSLIYENLGVNFARLHKFNKAEEYLVKSSNDKKQQDSGHLFMWLGYVYLMKERYEDSINCFLKAREFGKKGLDRLVVDRQYIQNRIDQLDAEIKNKYKEILTNN